LKIFPRDQQTPEMLGAMVAADAEKWCHPISNIGTKTPTKISERHIRCYD